jgi:hypothetical protein
MRPFYVSKKRYFAAKPIRSLEKKQILALKMTIFQNCGPRAGLGWPWLYYPIDKLLQLLLEDVCKLKFLRYSQINGANR